MKHLMILGCCCVAGTELLALALRQHRYVVGIAGVAAALLLFGFRRLLGRTVEAEPDDDDATGGDSLRRWLSHTQTMIHWAESTRTDWDRHWRPILAQRFANATGGSRAKGVAAFNATGVMLFGDQLWQWVDPSNVAYGDTQEPGPGRCALEEILDRLERA